MVEPSEFFESSQKLTSIFGAWPSFHDAEVTDIHLWRGNVKPGDWDDSNVFPVLTMSVRILEATQPDSVGDSGRDVSAKLRFHDIDDLKMEGFNHKNEILGSSVTARDRGTYANGETLPPDFRVIFQSGFGMAASFRCSRAEIAGRSYRSRTSFRNALMAPSPDDPMGTVASGRSAVAYLPTLGMS